jgi:hypothetical protein
MIIDEHLTVSEAVQWCAGAVSHGPDLPGQQRIRRSNRINRDSAMTSM